MDAPTPSSGDIQTNAAPSEWRTDDLHCAAYLRFRGARALRVQPSDFDPKRFIVVFEYNDNLQDAVAEWGCGQADGHKRLLKEADAIHAWLRSVRSSVKEGRR